MTISTPPAPPAPQKSILTETKNFIRLYRYQCGRTEVPTDYHLWSCLSLISACVSNRVYYKKFADSKLFPNLYVLLIGPSGSGKGNAINSAVRLVKDIQYRIPTYLGNITKQALIDVLATNTRKGLVSANNMWMISPELGDDVPPGTYGEELIRFMTKIYEGDFPIPIREQTRLRGRNEIINPCINWLAGTTKEWLTLSLPRYAMEAGSLARIVTVTGAYNPGLRIVNPVYPHDRDDVIEEINGRILEMCYVGGEFVLGPGAQQIDEEWYNTRESPVDESLYPFWKRQHDLVLKLAMILSLADDLSLVVRREHIARAQILSDGLHKKLPELISLASVTRETEGSDIVERLIKQFGRIPRHVLAAKVSKRMNVRRMDELLGMLLAARKIDVVKSQTGGQVYIWNGGKTSGRLSKVKED